MKNKRITTTAAFLLAAVMLTGLNAQTARRYGQGEGFHGRQFHQRHQQVAEHFSLDLTDVQKEEMQALRSAQYKAMNPLKLKMDELKAREKTLLSEEPVDLKAVHKVIDEQTDLMNKIRKLEVEHRLKVKSILTDEQVMKMEQRNSMHRQFRRYPKQVG